MRLPPSPRAPRLSRAALIVLLYGGLGAIAVLWNALRGRTEIYFYRPPTGSGSLGVIRFIVGPLCGLAFGLSGVFLSRVAVHRFEWARTLHREFHAVVHQLGGREIFLLAAASSIGEELFFRGALLPAVGLSLSSLVFALLHVRPDPRFLPWTAMSFMVGLVLGTMYTTLGDLGAPIAAHFTINLLNLHYIARNELRG